MTIDFRDQEKKVWWKSVSKKLNRQDDDALEERNEMALILEIMILFSCVKDEKKAKHEKENLDKDEHK